MGHHDSRTIANWFIYRTKRGRDRALTNMQLQKLVYFAHGWALALHNDPLIKDPIEAWEFGPVIPPLYRSLARWGSDPVVEPIEVAPETLEPYEQEVLEKVYEAYAKFPASTLSALTHRKGSPWEQVFEPGSRGLRIEDAVIQDHFADLATSVAD